MRGAVVLVPVERVARLARRHCERFLRRAFSAEERAQCEGRHADERLAARLAAKTAARKLFPDDRLPLSAIQVLRDEAGAPRISVHGVPDTRVFVSLSHDGGVAAAAVFVEPGAP